MEDEVDKKMKARVPDKSAMQKIQEEYDRSLQAIREDFNKKLKEMQEEYDRTLEEEEDISFDWMGDS